LNITDSAPVGEDDVINRLNHQSKECPKQKFALVGYSQGAGVVHGAFASTKRPYPGGPAVRPKLDAGVMDKILALVMFGDPAYSGSTGPSNVAPTFPDPLYAKLRENCAPGDPVYPIY
jgi:cutinase